jgi:hypothetical protein
VPIAESSMQQRGMALGGRDRDETSRARAPDRPYETGQDRTGQDMARCTVPTVRACPVCVRVPPPRCMARGWLSRSLHGDLHDLHFCSAPVPSGPGRNVLGQHRATSSSDGGSCRLQRCSRSSTGGSGAVRRRCGSAPNGTRSQAQNRGKQRLSFSSQIQSTVVCSAPW